MKRLPSLDGLRAFSIALVCIGHVAGTVGSPELLLPFHNLGNFGVKIFFVISGFLITYLLIQEDERNGGINLKSFYIRRVFRLLPAFYFYVICIAIAEVVGFIELNKGDLLHASTYTMNYHHDRAWWLNHTWSLAVEEQFYLIWPLLLLISGFMRSKRIIVVVILVTPVIRALMWYGFEASPSAMSREFQAVADALATGCLFAYLYKEKWPIPSWLKTMWFYLVPITMLIIPAICMKLSPALFYILGQSYINVCAVLMIWRFLVVQKGLLYQVLNLRPVMWVGTLSYSLYLWQEPFLNSWVRDWYASWPMNIALTFICACLSYYFVDKQYLKLRRDKITI